MKKNKIKAKDIRNVDALTSLERAITQSKTNTTSQTAAPVVKPFAGAAKFSIKVAVTKAGTVPDSGFPVYIFGSVHKAADYRDVLESAPDGWDLTISENTSGGVTLTYDDGGGVNSVAYAITSPTLSYRALLEMLKTDMFKTSAIRVAVNDEAQASAQFSEAFKVFDKSLFGGSKSNSIDVDSNKPATDNIENIVDIVEPISIDKQKGIVWNVLPNVSSITMTFITSFYSKQVNN